MKMDRNAKSSASPSDGAAPPLRSTTVRCSPATNFATGGGPNARANFIRLNTYHDSSDLKAAMRKLEAAFASPDNTAASSAPAAPASPSSFPSTEPIRSGGSGSRTATLAQESTVPSSNQAKVTVVVQSRSAAASPSACPPSLPARKKAAAPSRLMQLPSQLVLRCFAFCELKTLGVLCCVSVRLNVIVGQQGNALWAAAALRRRIPIANASASRVELRCALEQRAHARRAEEEFYESEISRMEKRLRARAEEVYAQNVDVERTIAGCGGQAGVNGASDAAPPYWLRQQRVAERGPDVGGSEGSFAADRSSTSAQLCAKLRADIDALEETKRLCECRLGLQEDSLRQQEAQLWRWQALLSPGGVPGASALDPVGSSPGEAAASSLITAAQLEQFERRIARLVLNGSIATSATAITGAGAGDDEKAAGIPFVFRRGVEDFATLELVLRAVGAHACTEHATASVEGSLAAPSAAARDAEKRWRAFQQVCPVNEEYGNVRFYLRSQELRAAMPSSTSSRQLNDGSGGRPSAKQTPALLRVSGFVRRVEAMTDSQVVQAWM
ncbi:hypothetical protein ABL78_4492 [Leptomonas seymouri]|uniref:F-box domain-containing protein n=1 Tax=Leptomonas seymouri TaxID=5684 RepID=A0A0N1HY58_LEPSE|nr:hypothetical protein ABL78_4492 [Leptomonas seymouri]|eukprot:KPI86461.1 hypothetical protein ABL78_4492 [Leptomonas seymouri]